MKREEMVRLLAPRAPDCFPSRSIWLSYLYAHAAEQRREHEPGPLIFTPEGVAIADADAALRSTERRGRGPTVLIFKGKHVSFNYAISFCADCEPEYRDRMARAGLCRPNYLTEGDAP